MSETPEDAFFRKHGKRWAMLTRESAYKEAIATAKLIHPAFQVLDKALGEIQGAGNLMIAQQQAAIQTFTILDTLAAVPPEYSELDEPPESDRYPDPIEDFSDEPKITRRRK